MSALGSPLELLMTRSSKQRYIAFMAQGGLCYYCAQPMWLVDRNTFAERHGLSGRQALQFQCTAEHLQPRSLGGTLCVGNIAAACLCCNQRRGRLGEPEDPDVFRRRVQKRCKVNKWHSCFPVGAPNNSFKPKPLRGSA